MWVKFFPLFPESVCFGRLYFPKTITTFPIPHALLQWDLATPPSRSRVWLSSSQIYTGLNDSLVTNRMWQKWYWDFRAYISRSLAAFFRLWRTQSPEAGKLWKAPATWRGHVVPLVNCSSWAQPSSRLSPGTTSVKKSSWKWILQPQLFQLPLIKSHPAILVFPSENPDIVEQTIPIVSSLNSQPNNVWE